jgi:hypothetical protein
MTFLTRRKLRKSWDCDARELRLVLRLPRGYRFTGMEIGCCRINLEYYAEDAPGVVLSDTLDLQVPVRGPEAIHALREENGEEVLNVWVPRHYVTVPGHDPAMRQLCPSAGMPLWGEAAS